MKIRYRASIPTSANARLSTQWCLPLTLLLNPCSLYIPFSEKTYLGRESNGVIRWYLGRQFRPLCKSHTIESGLNPRHAALATCVVVSFVMGLLAGGIPHAPVS